MKRAKGRFLTLLLGLFILAACQTFVPQTVPVPVDLAGTAQAIITQQAQSKASETPEATVTPQPTPTQEIWSLAIYANKITDYAYIYRDLIVDLRGVQIIAGTDCQNLLDTHKFWNFRAAIMMDPDGDNPSAFDCGAKFEALGVPVVYLVNDDLSGIPSYIEDSRLISHFNDATDEEFIRAWFEKTTGWLPPPE